MRAGICTTLNKEVEICCSVKWMKKLNIRGLVIWPKILFAEARADVPSWVFRHELEHAYQIMRLGAFKFYFLFFCYSIRYGYHNNPFEIEARDAQQESLTQNEEKLLWKLADD